MIKSATRRGTVNFSRQGPRHKKGTIEIPFKGDIAWNHNSSDLETEDLTPRQGFFLIWILSIHWNSYQSKLNNNTGLCWQQYQIISFPNRSFAYPLEKGPFALWKRARVLSSKAPCSCAPGECFIDVSIRKQLVPNRSFKREVCLWNERCTLPVDFATGTLLTGLVR